MATEKDTDVSNGRSARKRSPSRRGKTTRPSLGGSRKAGTASARKGASRRGARRQPAVSERPDAPMSEALEDAQRAADNILGANPVLGLDPAEVLDAVKRLRRLLTANPALVARKEAAMALELVRVLLGRSRIEPDPSDRRFRHEVWRENAYYRRVMQAYLAWRNALREIVELADAEPRDRERARFILGQITAAAAPTNHVLGNPGFLNNAIRTRGRSVFRGVRHFIDDLLHNGGMPRQVDARAFQVGANLASSPGAVVFRNAVCEIIQYQPATARVDRTPVLVIPPQINKYYIVDLAPDKSFVGYAVAHEVQLFCISWRNPTPAQRDWGLETYVTACREAIDVVRDITNADSVNLIAACAGGFTTAVLLGYLWAVGEGRKVNSLTLLVTVLDTSADTLLGLFANEITIGAAIDQSRRKGVLDGKKMARAFAWLRPEDLVWSFFANNYLMGNDPPAFDVLYWNNDTTRLPAQFHADLLNIFRQNPLRRKGALKILGTPVDLGKVDCPVFIVAGATDHITPWQGCYLSTRMFAGPVRFVLSSSGHVQSIVNPPDNPRARFYVHDRHDLPAAEWLKQAETRHGSWWLYWREWIEARSVGRKRAPRQLGNRAYPAGDPAPGRYVHQR